MLAGIKEISSFLAAVLAGRTVKIDISPGIDLVNETDQIVFHGSFMSHVEIKLAVHSFLLRT